MTSAAKSTGQIDMNLDGGDALRVAFRRRNASGNDLVCLSLLWMALFVRTPPHRRRDFPLIFLPALAPRGHRSVARALTLRPWDPVGSVVQRTELRTS